MELRAMPHTNPTYRYGVAIYGGSYAQPDLSTPSHFVMAESLSEVRDLLWAMSYGRNVYQAETGEGAPVLDTPAYGDPGDGAYVYRVRRDDPQFAEVLDEPGDRARHAFAWLDTETPSHRAEFGPRGGIKIEVW